MPGASEQTSQVKVLNLNWTAGGDGEDGRFEAMIVTADGEKHTIAPSPAAVTARRCGVRAKAVDPDGSLVDDFRLHTIGPVTAVRNSPSPAATASLAIAEQIVGELALAPAPAGNRGLDTASRDCGPADRQPSALCPPGARP